MKTAALALAVLIASSSIASAKSCWLHKGSVLKLEQFGSRIEISYENPRAELTASGIQYGTPLIRGNVSGNQIFGEAFQYSNFCPGQPFSYQVVGTVSLDRKRIELSGTRERLQECKLSGGIDSVRLELQFLRQC